MDKNKNVLLKAVLDTSGISGTDIAKVQKILDKYTVKLAVDVDQAHLIDSVNRVLPSVLKELKNIPGVEIPININGDLLAKSVTQVVNDNKQLQTELGKTIALANKATQTESGQMDIKSQGISKFSNSLKNQFKKAGESFSQLFTVSSILSAGIDKTKETLSELKEVDTLLTQIGKSNNSLSKSDLSQIESNSFEVASDYGKKAADYISNVQVMSQAGYENVESMATLSTAIQSTGDLTSELANKYIIATDKAYQLEGSVNTLSKVLDGSNNITNNNAITMTELAEGMSIVGSQAANSGIAIEETTAALATMTASTQQSGSDMATAFKGILLNLQQVTDADEGIDSVSLRNYEQACTALNVSLKETKNGVTSLRQPMDILSDLSAAYSNLSSSDEKKSNLLSSLGGQDQAIALDALLSNWNMYEKMLQEYNNGSGSMQREAEKTTSSIEGSLNRLSNTWTSTVSNVANSDAIVTGINTLNGLLSVVNNITGALGSWGSLGLGAGLFASIKNVGRVKTSTLLKYADITCVLSDTIVFMYA